MGVKYNWPTHFACVALDKLLSLFESQFPALQKQDQCSDKQCLSSQEN